MGKSVTKKQLQEEILQQESNIQELARALNRAQVDVGQRNTQIARLEIQNKTLQTHLEKATALVGQYSDALLISVATQGQMSTRLEDVIKRYKELAAETA